MPATKTRAVVVTYGLAKLLWSVHDERPKLEDGCADGFALKHQELGRLAPVLQEDRCRRVHEHAALGLHLGTGDNDVVTHEAIQGPVHSR